jgi:hypothetical protein
MIPSFRIPGTLHKTSDDCNQIVAVEYCKDCCKTEARFYHCNNWDCPECYFHTAVRAAHRVEDRLLGVQAAFSKVGKFPGKIMHITFSIPESEYEDFDLGENWKKCIKYASMIGVNGGSVVFHPFRIKSEYRKKLFDAVKSMGLKGGLWSGIHSNVLNLDSWDCYVYFAPHFHVLGYYPKIVMKSNVFNDLTGWVYKAIGVGNERSVYRTARYLFTHTAVPEGHKQAVHYFGVASYSKTSSDTIKTKDFKKCPSCGSENYYLIRTGYSSYLLERLLVGEIKPADDDFFVHVRFTKTVKRYFVKDCGASVSWFEEVVSVP